MTMFYDRCTNFGNIWILEETEIIFWSIFM